MGKVLVGVVCGTHEQEMRWGGNGGGWLLVVSRGVMFGGCGGDRGLMKLKVRRSECGSSWFLWLQALWKHASVMVALLMYQYNDAA